MAITIRTTIIQAEGKQATGIPIPAEVVEALGSGKRPKVVASFNGYRYRNTISSSGNQFMLALSAEHRTAAKAQAGDEIELTLELDTAPRDVELPEDLAAALADQPGASAAFQALAPSMRKEYVRQIETAKAAETRQRRILAILAKLNGTNPTP